MWLLPLGGPLAIGAPEDVALSGALERTFVSDRLVFDRGEGTFRLREEPVRAAVVLEGDGLARRWVERALRREGLAAIDASGAAAGDVGATASVPPTIATVRLGENAPRYLLEIDGERVECASLHDLVRRLRETRASPRPADRT